VVYCHRTAPTFVGVLFYDMTWLLCVLLAFK
jgi:hypothetical protein